MSDEEKYREWAKDMANQEFPPPPTAPEGYEEYDVFEDGESVGKLIITKDGMSWEGLKDA